MWTNLGDGMNDPVWALAVDPAGNLYAGGWFTTADGNTANYVARWNGSVWTNLGDGMSDWVNALAVDAASNLYAGGTFSTAGGESANRIARWNGSSWTNLGSGIGAGWSDTVNALAVDSSGNLYVGGDFALAGNKVSAGVAYARLNGDTDTDNDGIPDWWESLHYGGATNASPSAMASNGVNTVLNAWIADLDPTNPASVFVISALSNAPGGAASVLAAPGSTGRVYQLYSTTNLADSPQIWPPYGPVQTGTGAGVVFTVTNDATRRSYRTGVMLP